MENQPAQSQEFSDSEIRFTVAKKPGCIVEFDLRASPTLVSEGKKIGLRAVAKEVTIAGFRKGKAPDALILKKFPAEIDKRWQEKIADLCFQRSIHIAKIYPLSRETRITFNMKSHSLEEGAHLILAFEIMPEIPAIDPSFFTVKMPEEIAITEERLAETLRQVQFFFATWTPVTDRPVKEGDFVLLDVEILDDTPPTKLFSNTRFEVTAKGMAKWMHDLVPGMHTGEGREGTSLPDEELSPEEKEQFKPKKVLITVKAIELAALPSLDESLAKQLGSSDVETLKKNVKALLTRQVEEKKREKLREQASEFLLGHYRFDLPPSLVKKEAQFRMKQLMDDTNFQNHWNSLNTEERNKIIQSILALSEKAVRIFYLSQKLIKDNQLTVSPEDLHQSQPTLLEVLLHPQAAAPSPEGTEMQQAEAYSRCLLEKAEDFLVERANRS
jgi:trigger factor